ncbi:uncharacterized protein LOC106701959 [Latimeria chalumnae]|uniref:uncharacterized protein LOC106701959 n=1 Tax=Latimeria chalumnae TaxID=7897 RepID=UPI00313F0BF7
MAPTLKSTKLQESEVTPLHQRQEQPKLRKRIAYPPGEGIQENTGHTHAKELRFIQRPVTPVISKTVANLMSNIESSCKLPNKIVSPNLAMLRMTPGPSLKEKQRLLQEKHKAARSSADRLAVGGGVSLWPEMDTMRLTTEEGVLLFLSSVLLSLAVFIVFKHLHGPLHLSLHHYISNVRTFHRNHPIISESSMALNHSVIRWHKNFRRLLVS